MSRNAQAFEEPILEVQAALEGLKAQPENPRTTKEIQKLEQKLAKLQRDIYANLTDWQRCLVARHPNRPYTRDYVEQLFVDFEELHGDRRFADDPAIMAGFARFRGQTVAIIGHQKGRDMKAKLYRNFGMPRPEGYRKAMRIMQLAEKFRRPIICMIDTPGAYPGIDAEERGQAEAIAYNLWAMARLKVPIAVIVIGEGGSGGALALGVGDHIAMLENSVYSVISPEGCASILWKDASQMEQAAEALHLTSRKLLKLGLIDSIIEEPLGGAHQDPVEMAKRVGDHIAAWLQDSFGVSDSERVALRYQKFRAMGIYSEVG
ncbi:MAG: acetyl-CoA carboxylase carboxyltransferase subunit alpha [Acidobacteria bacterium]|nr:acetyl-CoA carboxylase carboxyltransferase subunit alpha [Acidobacteriota bacterium]